jgi:hypothetical protein
MTITLDSVCTIRDNLFHHEYSTGHPTALPNDYGLVSQSIILWNHADSIGFQTVPEFHGSRLVPWDLEDHWKRPKIPWIQCETMVEMVYLLSGSPWLPMEPRWYHFEPQRGNTVDSVF